MTLLEALEAVVPIQPVLGPPHHTHVSLLNGYLVASSGMLTRGVPVQGQLQGAPHTRRLLAALKACPEGKTLGVVEENAFLTLKAGKFSAKVPVLPLDALNIVTPDTAQYQLTNAFRDACSLVAPIIASEGRDICMAVFIDNGVASATNGHMILQAWHGCVLPPLALPKDFVDNLAKIKDDIVAFGFTEKKSITLYFSDHSWLKTQVYETKAPQFEKIIGPLVGTACPPISEDLREALKQLKPFSTNTAELYFKADTLVSFTEEHGVATYDVPGLNVGSPVCAKHEYVTTLLKNCTHLCLCANAGTVTERSNDGVIYATGVNFHGMLAPIRPRGNV